MSGRHPDEHAAALRHRRPQVIKVAQARDGDFDQLAPQGLLSLDRTAVGTACCCPRTTGHGHGTV